MEVIHLYMEGAMGQEQEWPWMSTPWSELETPNSLADPALSAKEDTSQEPS